MRIFAPFKDFPKIHSGPLWLCERQKSGMAVLISPANSINRVCNPYSLCFPCQIEGINGNTMSAEFLDPDKKGIKPKWFCFLQLSITSPDVRCPIFIKVIFNSFTSGNIDRSEKCFSINFVCFGKHAWEDTGTVFYDHLLIKFFLQQPSYPARLHQSL